MVMIVMLMRRVQTWAPERISVHVMKDLKEMESFVLVRFKTCDFHIIQNEMEFKDFFPTATSRDNYTRCKLIIL